jgi:prepilin-type N-terminal cleavage/methylation domain-containing protein/prepilin-type processing-associated H-X9-DG protein
MRCRAPAFTLVELLVVMGVLAVLAALLLPALASSREKARSVRCVANLGQWGLAFRMYADDNEDYLPRRGQGVQTLERIDRPDDWFNALPPYFNLPPFGVLATNGQGPKAHCQSVFVCPTAKEAGGKYFLSYGMNMNLSPWNLPRATKYSEVAQPTHVVAMADAPGAYSSTYPSARAYGAVARHSRRINLLFLGGQVQTFAGTYVGCGVGDPGLAEVRWLTGTASDTQAHNY